MTDGTALAPFGPRLGHTWPEGVRWRCVDSTVGFFDVSGYTRLTERLARLGAAGAEAITEIADRLFVGLISAAFAYGGDVLQFSGDAVLVHFTGPDHAVRGVRAADAMQRFIRSEGGVETELGRVRLRMSVGMHSGDAMFALLGAEQRAVLALGEHVSAMLAAEKEADAGQILVTRELADRLDPRWCGSDRGRFVRMRALPHAELPPLDPGVLRPPVADAPARAFVPAPLRSLLAHDGLPGEHRQVSIAFVGVKQLDRAIATDGPDAVVERLDALAQRIEALQRDYAVAWVGTDALPGAADFLLVTGTPAASEDDEDRILLACRELMGADLGLDLAIGVNRGRNFSGVVGHPWRRAYSISGDATNLAARIMAHAEPGQLLVHEPVLARVRGRARVTPQPPFAAKGKRLPVATVALESIESIAPTPTRATETFGRALELEELRGLLTAARDAVGAGVEIVAPAGFGKSHLLAALRADAAGVRWIQVGGEPYARTRPLHVMRRLVRELVDADETTTPEAVTRRVRRALRSRAPKLAPWLPLVVDVAGGARVRTTETDRLHPDFVADQRDTAVAELVRATLEVPTVLVVEDLHWIDDASITILERVGRGLRGRPVLLIVTRRPEGPSVVPEDERWHRIELTAIPEAASAALLVEAAGETALSEQRLRALVQRAGGNPLFLRELGAAAATGADAVVPETVERVIAARIDRLDHHDRLLLREAAVAGNPVDLGVLARALDRPELIEPSTWRGAQGIAEVVDGQLHFSHDLARAAAYEGLAHTRRRAVHAAIARELVAGEPADATGLAALLALHWSEAREWAQAWTWGRRAVDDAVAHSAPTDAAVLARRALDAARRLPDLPVAEVAALTEEAGDLANRIGNLDDAYAAFARARALVGADPLARARLARKQGDVAEKQGRYPLSLRWYRRGMRELDAADDAASRTAMDAELHLAYAATLHCQDHNAASRAMTLEALPAAEEHGGELVAQAYLQLATTTALLDRPDGEPYASRAVEVIGGQADSLRLACLHLNLGAAAFGANRFESAARHYALAETQFGECGDAVGAALALHNRGELLALLGDDDAVACFTDALRRFRASDYRAGELLASSGLGRAAAFAGDLERARTLLVRAGDGFTALGHRAFALDTELRLAEVDLLAGDVAAADRRLAAVAGRLDPEDHEDLLGVWLDRLRAAVLARQGRDRDADALLRTVVTRAEGAGLEVEAATALDALVTVGGDDTDGLAERRDAIAERLGIVRLLRI